MSETTGWGIVGTGAMVEEFVLPALAQTRGARVAAVMSSSQARADAFAAEHGIPGAYGELDALLAADDVDAVYIATRNELHREQTTAAAAAGKHVLCEKPLALTDEDAAAMIDACADAGVVFGTNHHLRNAPTSRAMQRLVAEGAIGRPLAVRVHFSVLLPEHAQTWRLSGPGSGPVFDLTVHSVDLVRFLLGREIVEVTSLAANQGMAPAGEADHVMTLMRLEDDVLVHLDDAFTVPHAGTGLEIHGTEGSLIGREAMWQRPVGTVELRRGDVSTPVEVESVDSTYVGVFERFQAAMRGDGLPVATGEDGRRAVAAALAVLASFSSGRRVTLAP